MAENQIEKMRLSHHAIIDLMIANPWMTQVEVAQASGYSANWVSILINSDVFKSEVNRRRKEMDSAITNVMASDIQTDITANLRSMALAGITKTSNLIASSTNLDQVANATEFALKSLGYGEAKKSVEPPQQNITVNIDQRSIPQQLINARNVFGRPLPLEPVEVITHDVLPAAEAESLQLPESCEESGRPPQESELRPGIAYYK